MKPTLAVRAFLLSLLTLPVLTTGALAQAGGAAEVLTNDAVVQMFTAKVPKGIIVTKVQTTKSNFDITPAGLIGLNNNKVPGDVIKQMMTAAGDTKKETLNNDAVIKMVTAALSKDIVVTKIQMSKANYDLTSSGLIALNQNKVSQDIIKAMMAATSASTTGH